MHGCRVVCWGYLNILIGQTEIKHLLVCNDNMPQFLEKNYKAEKSRLFESQEFLAAGYSREIFGVLF